MAKDEMGLLTFDLNEDMSNERLLEISEGKGVYNTTLRLDAQAMLLKRLDAINLPIP